MALESPKSQTRSDLSFSVQGRPFRCRASQTVRSDLVQDHKDDGVNGIQTG